MVAVLGACSSAQPPRVTARGLIREFAAVTDSIAFLTETACCDADVLVMRPRGAWTLLRLGRVEREFQVPADSVAYRTVAERLIGWGAAAGWPPKFGRLWSDTPVATLTIRAPGQCHQTTAIRPSGAAEPGDSLPAEWLAALRLLDSLIARVPWHADGVRPLPADAAATPRIRWLCGAQESG
jgi:hypothetical protein